MCTKMNNLSHVRQPFSMTFYLNMRAHSLIIIHILLLLYVQDNSQNVFVFSR